MKKRVLLAASLLLVAGFASAQQQPVSDNGGLAPRYVDVPVPNGKIVPLGPSTAKGQWGNQDSSVDLPVITPGQLNQRERRPVAGVTRQEDPQPANKLTTLSEDANRLIRWQPWVYRSAFSASVIEQIQSKINTKKISLGKIDTTTGDIVVAESVDGCGKVTYRLTRKTLHCLGGKSVVSTPSDSVKTYSIEEAIDAKIIKAEYVDKDGYLDLDKYAQNFKLRVWTYRHNYTDTGLYQLYVSGEFQLDSDKLTVRKIRKGYRVPPLKDIQALQYEFDEPQVVEGNDIIVDVEDVVKEPIDVQIWRGVVVRVNARGEVTVVGIENADKAAIDKGTEEYKDAKPGREVTTNPAGVNTGLWYPNGKSPADGYTWHFDTVLASPVADWEYAPPLPRDAYDPTEAKDRPPYFHPYNRTIDIPEKALYNEGLTPTTEAKAGLQVRPNNRGTTKARTPFTRFRGLR
jgi:hypothetical protein